MATGVELSVVIVTVGRPRQLQVTLEAMEALDPATPPFEAIVVLDGAGTESGEVARRPRNYPVTVREQVRAGIGPAKNVGARCASGGLLLFLNDDTRPAAGCLLAHARAQERHGDCIAVGHVDWEPRRPVTRYMAWLAPAGHQFNYRRLPPHGRIDWRSVWGPNLAVPRTWLLDEPFAPDHPFMAMEDSEWGYRQERRGRPAVYVPDARCLHDHYYGGPRDYRSRALTSGAAARATARRHPALAAALVLRPVAAAKAALLLALLPWRWRRETLWDLHYRWHYVAGLLWPSLGQRPR